jgi:hypothetical protein
MDHFVGLGQLHANQLASLADTRLPVGEGQYRTARAAWNAFTSPDPAEIERFVATDTSALPFIAAALRRHLEQFPSADNGLSRTERQALSVLREQGSLSGPRLFVAVRDLEEQVFMGDGSFYRTVADLSDVPHPLVPPAWKKTSRPAEKASVTRTLAERNRFYTTFQEPEHPAKAACTSRTSLETLILVLRLTKAAVRTYCRSRKQSVCNGTMPCILRSAQVSQAKARLALSAFPAACEKVYDLISCLKSNTDPQHGDGLANVRG